MGWNSLFTGAASLLMLLTTTKKSGIKGITSFVKLKRIKGSLREIEALPSVENTRQRSKYTRQSLCRVPHSAKSTRQNSSRQRGLCRVFFIRHSKKKNKKSRKNRKKIVFWKGCPTASTRWHTLHIFFQLFSYKINKYAASRIRTCDRTKSTNMPRAGFEPAIVSSRSSLLHHCTRPSVVITLRFGSSCIILNHM